MDCNMPGFPVLHYLPEFAQTHVHWVSDAIQLSHPLSSPSPLVLSLSQHQGLSNKWALCITWSKHQNFSFSINPSDEYSVLNSFRMEWSDLLAVSKIHHWEWSKKGVRGKCPLSGISGTPHFWSGWPDLLTVPPLDGVGSELREVHLLLSASGSDARLI